MDTNSSLEGFDVDSVGKTATTGIPSVSDSESTLTDGFLAANWFIATKPVTKHDMAISPSSTKGLGVALMARDLTGLTLYTLKVASLVSVGNVLVLISFSRVSSEFVSIEFNAFFSGWPLERLLAEANE